MNGNFVHWLSQPPEYNYAVGLLMLATAGLFWFYLNTCQKVKKEIDAEIIAYQQQTNLVVRTKWRGNYVFDSDGKQLIRCHDMASLRAFLQGYSAALKVK